MQTSSGRNQTPSVGQFDHEWWRPCHPVFRHHTGDAALSPVDVCVCVCAIVYVYVRMWAYASMTSSVRHGALFPAGVGIYIYIYIYICICVSDVCIYIYVYRKGCKYVNLCIRVCVYAILPSAQLHRATIFIIKCTHTHTYYMHRCK